MPADHRKSAKPSLTNRSRVSNGKTMHSGVDGRSADARRFRDLVIALSEDISNPDEFARSLVRRTAGLIVEAERIEGLMVSGQDFPRDTYVTMCGLINRCHDRLTELKQRTLYLQSEQAKAEREAWLNSLSEPELLELKKQVIGEAPPRSKR